MGFIKNLMSKEDKVDNIDGNEYYAKGDRVLAKNETITKWGKKYTFDENGCLVK